MGIFKTFIAKIVKHTDIRAEITVYQNFYTHYLASTITTIEASVTRALLVNIAQPRLILLQTRGKGVILQKH